MSMVKLYIYNVETGLLSYVRTGVVDNVIVDIPDNYDFTLTPPPDYEHIWRWIENKWLADEHEPIPIEQLQNEVWEDIKATRFAKIESGVYIPSIDKYVHTDAQAAAMYAQIGSSILLGTFEGVNWKAMDNTFFAMTESVFKEIQTEMMRQTQRYHAKAEYHKVMMLAANDPLSYNYHDDW